jgi:transcriptional regulator with XRE-family HTH domain
MIIIGYLMNTPEKLRSLIIMKNITQSTLAKELGISINSVNRYENDTRIPKEETLKKLADYYGVASDDLK